MRTWTLRTSRRHSRTRTRSSCLRRRRTRPAGSSRRAPWIVPSTGIGARAGPCGTSLLGPPRGGGRGGRGRGGGRRKPLSPLLYAPLVACGYDAVGKGHALAFRCLALVCVHSRARHLHGWFVGYDAVLAVFPLSLAGPRCSAPWPVRTRGTVMQLAGFIGIAPRAVVPLRCRQAQDAPHHGRYGPEGQLCGWFCWYFTSRCVHSCRLQAQDACHHDQYGPEGAVRGAVQKTADFPQLPVHRRSSISLSWRRGLSHGPDCSSDHRNSPVAR